MKIALMNEFSQASKNAIIFNELVAATAHQGHTIFNVGMCDDNDHRLTYVHLGIISAILLNSRSVDFVITGCGTGQCIPIIYLCKQVGICWFDAITTSNSRECVQCHQCPLSCTTAGNNEINRSAV